MKKLKKALSLSLALALSLAMAVPAFADASYDFSNTISFDGEEGSVYNANYSANGYTDPTAENVNFSVVPVGVARIRWVSSWRICEFTAYVFDQDCLVTRKDGLPLTGVTVMAFDDGNYGLINSPHYWPYEWIKSATLFADDDSGCAYNFSTSDDVGSPYMISKKSIDTVFPFDNEYGHTGTLLEYRPLSAQPATPDQPEQPDQPDQPAVPDAPGTYTVKRGDTWSSICTNFYGTNAQRYALQNANKNVKLKEGTVITLPEKLGKDTLIPAPAAAEGEKLYTVKAGDTLGKIAAAEYGRAGEYQAIFERNADRLKNANTIYEGQVIVLPAKK
ncbi:LysM peptidoglycan-binding domain-containing protein [Oscillospiraceae bacterium 44-34]